LRSHQQELGAQDIHGDGSELRRDLLTARSGRADRCGGCGSQIDGRDHGADRSRRDVAGCRRGPVATRTVVVRSGPRASRSRRLGCRARTRSNGSDRVLPGGLGGTGIEIAASPPSPSVSPGSGCGVGAVVEWSGTPSLSGRAAARISPFSSSRRARRWQSRSVTHAVVRLQMLGWRRKRAGRTLGVDRTAATDGLDAAARRPKIAALVRRLVRLEGVRSAPAYDEVTPCRRRDWMTVSRASGGVSPFRSYRPVPSQ